MTVRIEGLKELEKALTEMKTSTARGVVRRTLLKALEPMREAAEGYAPDDPSTGAPDLHRSIATGDKLKVGRMASVSGFGFKDGNVTVWMGPTRDGYPQAIMQEFGTVKQAAQPYMRPAWDAGKGQLLDDVKTGMGEEIRKTAERAAKRAAMKALRAG